MRRRISSGKDSAYTGKRRLHKPYIYMVGQELSEPRPGRRRASKPVEPAASARPVRGSVSRGDEAGIPPPLQAVGVFKHTDRSSRYNPFSYVSSDREIADLVISVINSIPHDGDEARPFTKMAENSLLTAVFMYVCYCEKEENRNISFAADLFLKGRSHIWIHTTQPKAGNAPAAAICAN